MDPIQSYSYSRYTQQYLIIWYYWLRKPNIADSETVPPTCRLYIRRVLEVEVAAVDEVEARRHEDDRHEPRSADVDESPPHAAEVDALHGLTHGHVALEGEQSDGQLGHVVWQEDHRSDDTTAIRTPHTATDRPDTVLSSGVASPWHRLF